jgi:hypothetical protein
VISPHDIVASDKGIQILLTAYQSDGITILDVTGSTVTIRWALADGTVEERAMTIVDGPTGQVQYTFATDEIIAPVMEFEVTVVRPDGAEITSKGTFTLAVRSRLA